MAPRVWVALLGAYLLGSIPSAYLAARWGAGVNILCIGDGNAGAKNTVESVGWLPGVIVAVADTGKGALAVSLARRLGLPENVLLWAGACVVLGHDFSLFLGFRGGQGMAAMVGVMGVLFPRELGLALLALAASLAVTHNWNLSCCIGFGLLPVLMGLFGRPTKHVLYPVLMLPTIGLRKLMAVWQARHARA